MDYHVHVFRLGTLGFGQGDGESGLRHFISPLSYEVLYLVSLKSIYVLSQKMSSNILRNFKNIFLVTASIPTSYIRRRTNSKGCISICFHS
jgi:hypothetical protein